LQIVERQLCVVVGGVLRGPITEITDELERWETAEDLRLLAMNMSVGNQEQMHKIIIENTQMFVDLLTSDLSLQLKAGLLAIVDRHLGI
jgi:hypothetical protein